MLSTRYVLWLSLFLVGTVHSCQAEERFGHSVEAEPASADSVEASSVPDPQEKGNYEGDPEILKTPPPAHYVEYLRTPVRTWKANELQKKQLLFSVGSTNQAPTMKSTLTISRNRHTMSVPEISQVAAPRQATFTAKQSGITAKSSPGKARSEDLFLANNRGLVDILLVMDNSGSMHVESTYIMRYLPELMKHVWRSDWRLGVVTSGPGDSCSITTASVKDAATATTLDFALARDSVVYSNFHRDLGYSSPRYLDPYFHYKDYKWLSYCRYSNQGYCSSYCSSSNDDTCLHSRYDHYNSSDYHNAKKDRHKYNPLWGYFKSAVTLPKKSTSDNGNEQLLRKLRWALEGKATTGCQGDWARENATVIAIVVTDEGHSCDNSDYTYCAIDSFESFVTEFRKKHPFKTYGVLGSKLLSDNRTRSPNWDSDELQAFDGYVINYRNRFEGGYVQGYFSGLPQGFRHSSPPTRVTSNYTSYYDKLSRYYGHRSLHLISMAIAEELRNIYSPLSYTPDTGSATVRVGDYSTTNNVGQYTYSAVSACRAGDTTNQGECYKVVNGAEGDAIELVNFNNMTHYDKKVKVAYTYGGTEVSAVPFDNSWELNFAPNPSTISVSVTLVDGTVNTLSASDYTLSGTTLSVSASNVQQLVPEGASISISYESPVTLQNSFTLDSQYQLPSGSGIVPRSVAVNIVHADSTTTALSSGFSFNGSVVSFSTGKAPAAGESFTMTYDYWGDVINTYDYSRHTNSDSSVAVSCKNNSSSNRTVSCTYDATDEEITFTNDSQFDNGDTIEITDTLQRTGSGVTIRDIDISSYEYAENEEIKITLGQDKCSTTGSSPNLLTINNGIIELAGVSGSECVIINSLNSNPSQEVTVHYWQYKNLPADFLQMDSSFFSQHSGKYKFEYWDVSVDSNPKSNFMIQDYKITEIDDTKTDESGMRTLFGNNVEIKVKVILYHAL